MLKTIDRLMEFIRYAGLSARQFDMSIGASNGYILRMQKNNASIGSDVIENILKTYPELNVVWLITGEGEMLKSGKETSLTDFNTLSKKEQRELEKMIDQKIRARQDEERKRLLKEVTREIEMARKNARK